MNPAPAAGVLAPHEYGRGVRQRDFMVRGDAAIDSAGSLTFGSAVSDYRPGCSVGECLVVRDGRRLTAGLRAGISAVMAAGCRTWSRMADPAKAWLVRTAMLSQAAPMCSRTGRGRLPGSVVDWLAADLVVGVEQRFSQQVVHVGSTEPVDNSASVSLALDESGETKLGEMLTCHGGSAAGHLSERRNVSIFFSQRPQEPNSSGIGQQGK